MKTIKLEKGIEKIFSVQHGRELDYEFDTIDMIKTAINIAPQGGFTAEDIFNVLQIQSEIKKLEENAVELELEDGYYKFLKEKVIAFRPLIAAQCFWDFKEQFK